MRATASAARVSRFTLDQHLIKPRGAMCFVKKLVVPELPHITLYGYKHTDQLT